jgi:hypothetical protein
VWQDSGWESEMSERDILERSHEETDESFLHRSRIALECLVRTESKDMSDLFYYWRDLRISRGRLPSKDDLDFQVLHDMGMLQRINIIDVSSGDPCNFKIVLHAVDAFVHSGINMWDRSIGEFPCRLHSRGLQFDYLQVKTFKAPRYFHIKQIAVGLYRHYARVILPLAFDGENIDALLTGVRTLESTTNLRLPSPKEFGQ